MIRRRPRRGPRERGYADGLAGRRATSAHAVYQEAWRRGHTLRLPAETPR